MGLGHLLLGLLVVAIWGSNFVVIKVALGSFPPILMAALRFASATVPAIFFFRRPQLPWRNLAAYGLLIGGGQFSLLYLAMQSQISPGLASLVVQAQVLFTVGLAVLLQGERVRLFQLLAALLALSGFAVIGLHTDGSTTWLGIVMVLGSGLCWALGNMVGRSAGRVNMLAYMVWTSAFSVPPLVALSLLVEGGPAVLGQAMADAPLLAWGAILWQSMANTLLGYGLWAWLLVRYDAATVTPLALLVPVFGMASSVALLGEPFPAWKAAAMLLVMAGLSLNVLWPRLRAAWLGRSG
ncbi:EamA family transporter [Comamonas sp. NLF-1-9]|uniref:EamA family transporter n=1 Tax=Comamonas sp. NLF-1-9 TaxID=2853163 RepID=UPI001C43AD68|nr:EamA family transporter [Comamonas sp. NLF-1-9]QXL85947.1 EamA family transporter [Comamonas sp. NLF-1-9]